MDVTNKQLKAAKSKSRAVTLSQLTSPEAVEAFRSAEYRLRNNSRYWTWTPEKERTFILKAAFNAAMKGK